MAAGARSRQERQPSKQRHQLRLTPGIGFAEHRGEMAANGMAAHLGLSGDIGGLITAGQLKSKAGLGRGEAEQTPKHERIWLQASVEVDQHDYVDAGGYGVRT